MENRFALTPRLWGEREIGDEVSSHRRNFLPALRLIGPFGRAEQSPTKKKKKKILKKVIRLVSVKEKKLAFYY
jgi:hypothetical protein